MIKNIFILFVIIFYSTVGYNQSNMSDDHTPLLDPLGKTNLCQGVKYDPKKEKCDCICGVIPIKDTCKKSPSVKLFCSPICCNKVTRKLYCTVFPTGGKLKIEVGGNLKLFSAPDNPNIRVKGITPGNGIITATYSVCGKTIKDTCTVKIANQITLTAPDTVFVCPGEVVHIQAIGYPEGGKYAWTEDQMDKLIITYETLKQPTLEFITKPTRSNIKTSVTVTYLVCDDKLMREVYIKVIVPRVSNVPVMKRVEVGKEYRFEPAINPKPKKIIWSAADGIKLTDSANGEVAKITALQNFPHTKLVTFKYLTSNDCWFERNIEITDSSNFNVILSPDVDTIYLCNSTNVIEAIGNPSGGVYGWTINQTPSSKNQITLITTNPSQNTLVIDYKLDATMDIASKVIGDISVVYQLGNKQVTSKKVIIKFGKGESFAEELKRIQQVYCDALNKIKVSGIGKGWLGNAESLAGNCIKINDALRDKAQILLQKQSFCFFRLASVDYGCFWYPFVGWSGHVYQAIIEKNNKVICWMDPWADGKPCKPSNFHFTPPPSCVGNQLFFGEPVVSPW